VGGPVPVISGKAQTTYTPNAVGNHTVTASYSGNANCGQSSDSKQLTVTKANTASTLLITDVHSVPVTNVPANTTVYLQGFVNPDPGCTLQASDIGQVVILDGNGFPVPGLTLVTHAITGG